ncbi:hypothetical protein OG413_11845 [Streptomyces sp. NBC_01433]|uniref:hypothetical protein n=1 Tax=Streptomyces sp. NBC_01433 TaxID=2903864 RepID=UPI00224E6365|nr:hypothetical protein [Streptomyces sp. NBC_01433]MCX4675991.1 hypothetical protein [Streptomyces sp. NBC_01433]
MNDVTDVELSLLPEPLRPMFARCLAADPAERATPEEVVERVTRIELALRGRRGLSGQRSRSRTT